MNHDDIFNLFELGIKLFTDVSNASHHHTNQILNTDNLSVAGDLAVIGHKLYKIGSEARRSSIPVFTKYNHAKIAGCAGTAECDPMTERMVCGDRL